VSDGEGSGGTGGATGGTHAMGGTGADGGAFTGATGGTIGGTGGAGGATAGAAGVAGSGGRCQNGVEQVIDRLCIRGTPVQNGEQILEGEEFRIELYPRGCFSSSCTVILDSSCTVTVSGSMRDELLIDGAVCHGTRAGEGVPCTDDCAGGGMEECPVEPLPAKTYFAIYDDLIVAVDVPSVVEPGGRCVSTVTDGPPPADRAPARSPAPR